MRSNLCGPRTDRVEQFVRYPAGIVAQWACAARNHSGQERCNPSHWGRGFGRNGMAGDPPARVGKSPVSNRSKSDFVSVGADHGTRLILLVQRWLWTDCETASVAAMTPVLYSFRRCPYAMRARLAIVAAGAKVELREVVLRDKPQAFLDASDSGTVPCLVTPETTLDESLDIMVWALRKSDPNRWLDMPDEGWDLIARCDGPFKHALDRTKYATRYPDADPEAMRDRAMAFLHDLERDMTQWVYGAPSLADYALLPFVRQFAFIDKARFDADAGPRVRGWLTRFLDCDCLEVIMPKFPQWHAGDPPVFFP